MLALVEEIFRRTPDERMREAYGYAVAVSTECGNAREDSEKRGFGFIGGVTPESETVKQDTLCREWG